VQMPYCPSGRVEARVRMIDRPAKEGELIPEAMSVNAGHMARVIPPFRAEVVVRSMVMRKNVRISWLRESEGNQMIRAHLQGGAGARSHSQKDGQEKGEVFRKGRQRHVT